MNNNMGYLVHYGTPRHSGRYPWGSGDRPKQRLEKRFGFKKIDNTDEVKNRLKTKAVESRSKKDYETIKLAQKWNDDERKKINGQEFLNSMKVMKFKVSRVFDKIDNTQLPLKSKTTSKDDDLKMVNPSKNSKLIGPTNNCCLCTIAYDLRRRGYDVIAKQNAPVDLLYDVGYEDVHNMYKNSKKIECKTAEKLKNELEKQPNGARGAAFCSWSGAGSGHVVAYEVENGKALLYDAQSGTKYSKISDLFYDIKSCSYMRLDNLEPDWRRIKLAIE